MASLAKKHWVFLVFLALFLFPGQVLSTEISQKDREQTYKKLELFSNILSILQENYVEEINTDQVIEGAINGLLHALDPHSSYLTPQSFQELQDETQGSFTGIGIEITIKKGKLTVVSPIEGTPAFEAGLRVNDVIVKIGDQWTKDMSPMDAVKTLRGPKGSEVTISIHREGWENIKEFTLMRDIIPLISVRSFFIDKNIAYTRITNFQSRTTEDYAVALKALEKEQNLHAIILDLRYNPGGLLNQAVSIADLFLDSGLIVYTKGRTEDQNMVFQARKSGTLSNIPLIVLVNEGSASASEIVAGAIQDHKRGLVLGTKTFGKGSVQTIVPLQDGAGLRMTTARYFTPSGRSIQVKGIIPDVVVDYIPQKEPEIPNSSVFPREGDLKNHFMNNQPSSTKSQTPESVVSDISQEIDTSDSKFIAKMKNDNQVLMALNIIKGIALLGSDNEMKQ